MKDAHTRNTDTDATSARISTTDAKAVLTGLAVSPGVGIGTAYCLREIPVTPLAGPLDEEATLTELARYEEACRAATAELESLHEKVISQVGADEAAIFQAHLAILQDPSLTEKIRRLIADRQTTAQFALRAVLDEYETTFARVQDEYLKERFSDLRDVMLRLNRQLTQQHIKSIFHAGPVVLVVHELLPSDVVTLTEQNVAGVVTQIGGPTSHAAVLARSYGIPAVSGIDGAIDRISQNDHLIVDGREGHVLINPTDEAKSSYRKVQREFIRLKDSLAHNHDQPAITADGVEIELLANINSFSDVDLAIAMGVQGIGLYRTEFFFLTHPNVPDEDEQVERYRQVIAAGPGKDVTIRTLDLGGDKTIAYLEGARETNPFMGWRSIRLSFEHPKFFLTQIRSILRAAGEEKKSVRLLFPMVTTLDELDHIRELVQHAEHELNGAGLPHSKVKLGIMIEVPVTAIGVETFLPEVDFVSIGSNDLVQYLTAADRDNPKVSHLCDPLNPTVLKVLATVIEACDRSKTPVTLCGEMAGTARGFVLLLGMGLRSFSISPAFIPSIKDLARSITTHQAKEIADGARWHRNATEVGGYVDREIAALSPATRLLAMS